MVSRTHAIRYLPVLVAMLVLVSCSKEAVTFNQVASGMQFETTESLFIYDAGQREGLILERPGTFSEVPVSAGDFQEHPRDWMFTDEYKERFGKLYMYPRANKVRLLMPGTVLTISTIKKRNSYSEGPWVEIWATVDDPQVAGSPVTVNVNRLFHDTAGKNANPITSKFLKRIS